MIHLLLLLAGCPPTDTPEDTATLACGTLTCTGAEVCIQESYEPECENRTDTGAACPEGTTASMCGGAGIPCCCGAAPEQTYSCHDAGTCGDTPACDCLGDVCPEGKECMGSGSESVFTCSEPPKP
ncbi:MAG: hypothetical protein Q8P41_26015 [Pseudomonadota bacterium]|nr:hypothetical protein [Pseudomonadota bacterium]